MRIVFDLDGTLIDSAPDIHAVANAVLGLWDAAPITLEQTRAFIGEGTPTLVARLRGARGLPDSAQAPMLAAFMERYESAVSLTRPYPGVAEALDRLVEGGHALGVCTNKPQAPARAVLAHLGLDRRLRAVVGGDSLPQRKPDPAPLHAAFAALAEGAHADSPCAYVGDSETDAETAHAAGVPFLLFTEGYRKGDIAAIAAAARFQDFADLPALVSAVAAASHRD